MTRFPATTQETPASGASSLAGGGSPIPTPAELAAAEDIVCRPTPDFGRDTVLKACAMVLRHSRSKLDVQMKATALRDAIGANDGF